jgi:ferrous iron transport protein B
MTCSARLPVYSLLIGAFIPHQQVMGFIELQGLVMLALYFTGILGALIIAWTLKTFTKAGQQVRPLMMELPRYRWPSPRNIVIGLWQRALIFLKRVGGTILFATIVIWFLCSFPLSNGLSQVASVEQSFAGIIGKHLAVLLEPVGFNWQISVSLIPGMLAREVSISSLGTVYSLSSGSAEGITDQLSFILSNQWSLATGLSLLAWFVFAPQCISTIMTIKRESGGWTMPLITISYLFTLAYLASLTVFQTAKYFGLG